MPFGVGEGVGVVALSLTCLNGCIKGLTILSKARHFHRDISSLSLQIELEQHYLETWADAAGLRNEPPTLFIDVNDAAFVPQILGQLDTLLGDLQQLKEKYGIDLRTISGKIEPLEDGVISSGKLGPKLQASAKRSKAFYQRSNPWRRLAWVTLDDKKFEKLLKEVHGYISSLEKLLEHSKQVNLLRDIDWILRDVVVHVNDQQKLDIVQRECEQVFPNAATATAAAARLKLTRFKLGLSNSSPLGGSINLQTEQGSPQDRPRNRRLSSGNLEHNMRLSIRFLTISRVAKGQNIRTLTYYDNRAVLLEWKNSIGLDLTIIERRVNQVAAFLHKLEPSFHSLPCQGYVRDHDLDRYGYVFSLPENLYSRPTSIHLPSEQNLAPLPELQTLRQLFDNNTIAPSLNGRLSISVRLLETLLNLHTSGWLHKGLRSDNLVFIRRAGYGAAFTDDISDFSMYVAGYVSARGNAPEEMTEPLESELEADLYRHPLSLGRSRLSFRKSFDIFSVGCTLLEIGLWTSFRGILKEHSGSQVRWRKQMDPERFSHHERSYTSRSTSTDATLVSDIKSENQAIDEWKHKGRPSSLDLMKLRHELLLSHLRSQQDLSAETDPKKRNDSGPSDPSGIFQSLEVATGKTYTRVVKELFCATILGENGKEEELNGDERALDLEIKARDTVQSILNAI